MKGFLIMVFMLCLLAGYRSHAQEARVTLNFSKTPIGRILNSIEQQSPYKFVYANNFFPAEKLVTIQVQEVSVEEALNRLLVNTGFNFRRADDLIILTSETNKRMVSGRVMNAGGEPLQGVTVSTHNGVKQTATDSKGNYSIETESGEQLYFSSIGYVTENITVNDNRAIDVQLREAVQDLGEVVMVGYGQRMKQDITGAVSMIGSRQIDQSQALSPEIAMQGQMAGVSVITGGSNPTARHRVRVRGVGTFSGNGAADPLYIIDGIPLVEGGAGATVDKTNDPTRRGPINLYTMINPNDIESIVVLKDAAAAIYGVRAANGVILITTKSGKKGPVRVDVNAVFGLQRLTRTYDVLNTSQYVKFYSDAYAANPDVQNDVPIPIGAAAQFGPFWNPSDPRYFGGAPTYDWQRAIIHNASRVQNYNIRTSGESENVNYSFSVGYSGNEGPYTGYSTGRYSVAANLVTRLGSVVELGLNVRGVQQNTDNTPGDIAGISMDIWRAPPWQKIVDAQGPGGFAPLWRLDAPLTPQRFEKSTLYAQQYVAYRNVFGLLANSQNLVQNQTGLGTAYLQLQPIKGMKLKAAISGQQTAIEIKTWLGFDRWWFEENPFNPFTNVIDPMEGTRPGITSIDNSATNSLVRSLNADYLFEKNNHQFNFTFDASQQNYRWTGNGASRSILTEDPSRRYFSTSGNENGYFELRANYSLVGYMGRLSYNFNRKYYGDIVVRRDGSSRFAPGKQWGTFPSALIAWRISKEPFMKKYAFVNDLKFRGGYGILGNEQTTGGWSYLAIAGVVRPSYNLGFPQGVNTGISFSSFPNKDLTWERLRTANLGIDAILFNNQLSLTADYYHKTTKGIIQSVELSPSTGITTTADINIAEVLNRGVELQLAYNKMMGKFGVNISGNFTTVHNEVLKLANNTALRNIGLEEGLPIGFIYGYRRAGIFQTDKEIEEWNITHRDIVSREQKPGDIYFQDLYGSPLPGTTIKSNIKDSVINENDRTYLGKTIAGYYYGLTTTFLMRSFDLTIFFQGVGDVQKYNQARALGESMDDFGRNQFVSVLQSWTETNKSKEMPRAVYNDPNGNNRVSDRFVENAGYIRLQHLQLGYNVAKKILDKTKVLQQFRVFFSVMNLFTLTKYTGLDPEDDNFPATKQFLFGLRASF